MAKLDKSIVADMAQHCLMMRSRLMARKITSIYEDGLRPFGIKGSQLNLLVAVAYAAPVRRSDIGRALHLDSSTLTRNLRIMENNGWIEEVADESDARGYPIRVSKAGRALLLEAAAAWKDAQRKVGRLLVDAGKAAIVNLSHDLIQL